MNYTDSFITKPQTENYARKMNTKIEQVRIQYELSVIKKYAQGLLFDCSVGAGTFIDELNVDYTGADYSREFLNYVSSNYGIKTKFNDLRKGIAEEDNKYDTVICIRTLNNLEEREMIIKEMLRIVKPGGYVIFDMPREYNAIKYPKNSFFVNKIKFSKFLFRVFNSKYNIIPIYFWCLVEKFCLIFNSNSYIYVIKK